MLLYGGTIKGIVDKDQSNHTQPHDYLNLLVFPLSNECALTGPSTLSMSLIVWKPKMGWAASDCSKQEHGKINNRSQQFIRTVSLKLKPNTQIPPKQKCLSERYSLMAPERVPIASRCREGL